MKDSQFIIITTLSGRWRRRSAIYGVTMEERGVSKTVSMRFNHEHGEPEAREPAPLSEAVASGAAFSPSPLPTGA